MKNLLIVIALAMCCCKQQTPECTYTFMGIPFDITKDEFNQKLIEKGFEKIDNNDFVGFFFGYYCTVTTIWDAYNRSVIGAIAAIEGAEESAFDDIKEALMEKYSDTAKWRIKYIIGDDCADGLTPRAFSIYSTSTDEDDDNSYIRMDWIPGLRYSLIHISYFNVDYDNEENLEKLRMQDL